MKASPPIRPRQERKETPIRTIDQASAFLEDLILPEPRPYAWRARFALPMVRQLLAGVGNPHHRLNVIHIAGSKGKGSTALLTEAILQAAGWRTGTFTSPHLQRWTERYRVDGHEVDTEFFSATLEQLRPHVEALRSTDPDNPPGFFDVATATALLLFRQAAIDYAIIEVGLGGRLDATNVVQPAVTCITSIELEHTDKLGNSLAAIAREKAGIIKSGVPVVLGSLPPSAEQEIAARARALKAPLLGLGKEAQATVTVGASGELSLQLNSGELAVDATLPVFGRHLAQNAALAAVCVQQLGILGPAELKDAIQRGLENARLPGRGEIFRRHPWVVVDTAHTPASVQALATMLAAIPAQRVHLVLSLSLDKDPLSVCAPLLAVAETVTVTMADPVRSLDPNRLAAIIRACYPNVTVWIVADPVFAVRSACQGLAADSLLCITGSVYMAGHARTALAENPAACMEAV